MTQFSCAEQERKWRRFCLFFPFSYSENEIGSDHAGRIVPANFPVSAFPNLTWSLVEDSEWASGAFSGGVESCSIAIASSFREKKRNR